MLPGAPIPGAFKSGNIDEWAPAEGFKRGEDPVPEPTGDVVLFRPCRTVHARLCLARLKMTQASFLLALGAPVTLEGGQHYAGGSGRSPEACQPCQGCLKRRLRAFTGRFSSAEKALGGGGAIALAQAGICSVPLGSDGVLRTPLKRACWHWPLTPDDCVRAGAARIEGLHARVGTGFNRLSCSGPLLPHCARPVLENPRNYRSSASR